MKVPQADDLGRVLLLPTYVKAGAVDSKALAEVAQLAPRQVLYYAEAAEMLGFIQREGKEFSLTELGVLFTSSEVKRTVAFEALKQMPIIQEVVKQACKNPRGIITKTQIAELVKEKGGLALVTAGRRANSVFNWLYWASYHFPQFCHCEGEQVEVYCEHGEISSE